MKKAKLVALTLAVAIMMMGAGYAYWSQTLTIAATVDTGELDVVFVEPTNVNNEYLQYQPNADATPNNHSMSITWTDIYPGLENQLQITFENRGTIGAYVDDFGITYSQGTNIPHHIAGQILVDKYKIGSGAWISTNGHNLASVLGMLNNGNGIFVEKAETEEVLLNVRFANSATELELPENSLFGFNVEASVYQFNGR